MEMVSFGYSFDLVCNCSIIFFSRVTKSAFIYSVLNLFILKSFDSSSSFQASNLEQLLFLFHQIKLYCLQIASERQNGENVSDLISAVV